MVKQWSSELSTGHDHIDQNHQELFQLVSMLDGAIRSQSVTRLRAIIEFLESYVSSHFAEEESIMLAHEFEGYAEHKEDHEIFKARVFSLRHDFDAGFPSASLYFAIRLFIDKLVIHIMSIDIKLSQISHADKESE